MYPPAYTEFTLKFTVVKCFIEGVDLRARVRSTGGRLKKQGERARRPTPLRASGRSRPLLSSLSPAEPVAAEAEQAAPEKHDGRRLRDRHVPIYEVVGTGSGCPVEAQVVAHPGDHREE